MAFPVEAPLFSFLHAGFDLQVSTRSSRLNMLMSKLDEYDFSCHVIVLSESVYITDWFNRCSNIGGIPSVGAEIAAKVSSST